MNMPLLHALTAIAAASAGWFAGVPASVEESSPRSRRTTAQAARTAPRNAVRPPWEKQIAAVRAVPGARAETAWIKWAIAIPDSDVPAAIATLNPNADFHALRCLYSRWAKLDPAAAWASFRKSRIPEKSEHFYLPDRDGEGGGSFVQSTLSTYPRALIAARMLSSMEAKDPTAAKALAVKLRTSGSDDAKDVTPVSYLSWELDRLLGKKGDESAVPSTQSAALAEAITDKSERSKALDKAARGWLQSDPAAACAWLRQLPDADRRQFNLTNLEYPLKKATPQDRALTLAVLLEGRDITGGAAKAIQPERTPGMPKMGVAGGIAVAASAVKEWAGQDAAAVQKWIPSLPEGDLKATLAGSVAGVLVRTDVNAGIALLNQTGGDQELAVGALMRGWMESDARAALAWAAKIDDATLRDTSRSTAARQIAATDPALALETAQTLTDPALRSGIFKQVRQALSWNPAALSELEAKYPGEEWQGSK